MMMLFAHVGSFTWTLTALLGASGVTLAASDAPPTHGASVAPAATAIGASHTDFIAGQQSQRLPEPDDRSESLGSTAGYAAFWARDPHIPSELANDLVLRFSPEVPVVWQEAFTNAAAEWSDGCVSIQTSGSGRIVDITVGRDVPSSWGASAAQAVDGIGSGIQINANEVCTYECTSGAAFIGDGGNFIAPDGCYEVCRSASNWLNTTPDVAYAMALHELGHILGFQHSVDTPETPYDVVLIPSTSSNPTDTIMYNWIDVNNPPTGLTADDVLARNVMYGAGPSGCRPASVYCYLVCDNRGIGGDGPPPASACQRICPADGDVEPVDDGDGLGFN